MNGWYSVSQVFGKEEESFAEMMMMPFNCSCRNKK
jgi:hypothetical protein